MADIENTISNLELNIRWICDNPAHQFPGYGNVEMAMRDALELLQQFRWIPVEERMPEPNTTVITYGLSGWSIPLKYRRRIIRGKEVCRWETDAGIWHYAVVAWMPMPDAPQEADKDGV